MTPPPFPFLKTPFPLFLIGVEWRSLILPLSPDVPDPLLSLPVRMASRFDAAHAQFSRRSKKPLLMK
jgi:hypothetical protein